MKSFTEEEWKEFQEKVKNQDKMQCDLIGVNIFVADIKIPEKKKY